RDRLDNVLARRAGIAIEQRLGRDQHPRRAVAALGREIFHERFLERVQLIAGRQSRGGVDAPAGNAFGKRQAGEMRLAIDRDRARAARAVTTAVFGAEVTDAAAQKLQKVLAGLRKGCPLRSIENEYYGCLCHQPRAIRSSRRLRCTPATSRRYQVVASASVGGSSPSAATCAARAMVDASRLWPSRTRSTALA